MISAIINIVLTVHVIKQCHQIKGLNHEAHHDSLTSLSNKRKFEKALDSLIKDNRKQKEENHLILADLNKFKAINDSYGHQCGDRVLSTVADILKKHVRGDDIVARIGGDEFAIILYNCDKENASRILNQLIGHLNSSFVAWEGRKVKIESSFSLMEVKKDYKCKKYLISVADELLYKAKAEKEHFVILD
jgi:Amt family ammonium transporter